jgi:hypothetical protein
MVSKCINIKSICTTCISIYFLILLVSCNQAVIIKTSECAVCERITLFSKCNELVGNKVWDGLNTATSNIPLLYFTYSSTYMAFGNEALLKNYKYEVLKCENSISLFKLNRLDAQPFHMENKMSFTDTASLYYNRPMMLCSDVETMHKFVPDFYKTEDWLQLVMHEYFHSYQFSHKPTFTYLKNTIKIPADTLDKIYTKNEWFSRELEKENTILLNAIASTAKDSMQVYISQFIKIRESRRKRYEQLYKFNLTVMENFWETIEGTARYVEYYMAGNFNQLADDTENNCDSLFKNFKDYAVNSNFEEKKEYKQRTKMMQAYHYVTGFNLCRLMDKLNISYKQGLFDNPAKGLYEIFRANVTEHSR